MKLVPILAAACLAAGLPQPSFLGSKAGDAREVAGIKLRWCPR